MAEIKETQFEGYAALEVSGSDLTVWVTISAGPRILGLSAFDRENMLAVLPGAVLECPGEGGLQLIGGHRLWYAPEIPERTYIPDGEPVAWEKTPNGITLTQAVEGSTGVQKQIQIEIGVDTPRLTVIHTLQNKGAGPIDLAPWAITQLRPGGVGVLPLNAAFSDPNGLQPNREVVLWPYTKINSGTIELTDRAVYVRAVMEEGALKIGASNPTGWLAYALGELLFVKRADYQLGGNYLDRGASSQIYCNPELIELETLAPLVTLQEGERTAHIEEWTVYRENDWPEEIAELIRLVERD